MALRRDVGGELTARGKRHRSRWLLFGFALLLVIGVLGMFSPWPGLGLVGLGVGTFGLTVTGGAILLKRFDVATGRPPETRAEAIWGWLKAATLGLLIAVAIFAGAPLAYVFGLIVALAVILGAIDVVIGLRAARQTDGDSGESSAP